ncbi:MAG: hypothetical protein D0530_00670 [Methylococcales bacterium]|nr:MAG: hypothetical protein D0530_00670 [Methylococcales bacterium]
MLSASTIPSGTDAAVFDGSRKVLNPLGADARLFVRTCGRWVRNQRFIWPTTKSAAGPVREVVGVTITNWLADAFPTVCHAKLAGISPARPGHAPATADCSGLAMTFVSCFLGISHNLFSIRRGAGRAQFRVATLNVIRVVVNQELKPF